MNNQDYIYPEVYIKDMGTRILMQTKARVFINGAYYLVNVYQDFSAPNGLTSAEKISLCNRFHYDCYNVIHCTSNDTDTQVKDLHGNLRYELDQNQKPERTRVQEIINCRFRYMKKDLELKVQPPLDEFLLDVAIGC